MRLFGIWQLRELLTAALDDLSDEDENLELSQDQGSHVFTHPEDETPDTTAR